MLVAQRIEQMAHTSQGARRDVGSFLLQRGRTIEDLTMQQIADATGTSKPTLVRIAKHLGFQGWAQLTKMFWRRPTGSPL